MYVCIYGVDVCYPRDKLPSELWSVYILPIDWHLCIKNRMPTSFLVTGISMAVLIKKPVFTGNKFDRSLQFHSSKKGFLNKFLAIEISVHFFMHKFQKTQALKCLNYQLYCMTKCIHSSLSTKKITCPIKNYHISA